jgi:dienelactone hydrolase
MMDSTTTSLRKRWKLTSWIRVGFILWALFVMSWLLNSVRTQDVDEAILRSNHILSVQNNATALTLQPNSVKSHTALLFFCGSGIAAEAYTPLLRPVAEEGFPVFIVKLPYRFAPRDADRDAAIGRAREVIASHPDIKRWVISGHSLGASLAARMTQTDLGMVAAIILVATTHPKESDLSSLRIPVTKVYGSNDGIAPAERVLANRGLLPRHTNWVEIAGANHSQFGRYGHQLFDGTATISRKEQEAQTRSVILRVLTEIEGRN